MKKYFLTLVCVLYLYTNIGVEPLLNYDPLFHFKKFLKAYKHVRKWEGNYSNLAYDKGGETYGGITKNFNPNWTGWEELERYKKDSVISWNEYIPDMERHTIQYYYDIWMKHGYYRIKEPVVANYVFDYRNTGIVAIKHIQQVLYEHGYNVKITKVMDDNTIDAINKINPIIFILHLQEVRKNFYISVAERNPDLEIYLKGWIRRANYISS
jgi:lysozyme family protein